MHLIIILSNRESTSLFSCVQAIIPPVKGFSVQSLYRNETTVNQPQPHLTHAPFNIIRDKAYQDTLNRDLRRQKVRRLAHRVNRWLEKRTLDRFFKKPCLLKTPSLSVCLMTMNAADRITPLLKYIRPHVQEIVVGVDSKSQDATLEVCQGLADQAFVIQNEALTCNGGLEPLISACTQEWILRLDDDEFPEPHFWDILPYFLSRPEVTHYKMPRLHLCNTEPLEWINDNYLYPDFQMRLFQNKPELLSFPGAVGHLGIQCAGKRGKINSADLIHLNLAINPRFKREAKLSTYIERLNGGWVHPVNEYALLFEDFDYAIQPYTSNNRSFDEQLIKTVAHQRSKYLAQQGSDIT